MACLPSRENVIAYALNRLLDASEMVDLARRMLWVAESLPPSELEGLDRTRTGLQSVVRAAVDRMFPDYSFRKYVRFALILCGADVAVNALH